MRLIRPSYEIIEQGPGLQGIYDIIERCGKTSYKSEVKGGEDAKRFVEARVKEMHGAVLEFGTVYLKIESPNWLAINKVYSWDDSDTIVFYKGNSHSRVNEHGNYVYITTNYRVLVENNRLDDLKYLCEPTEYHEKRYCVKFITDIGVGREFLRHRTMSMVQESTRYVNYSKEKFNGEVAYIIPQWLSANNYSSEWRGALETAERSYLSLINNYGWTPQQARGVLPLATKTEFVLCGFKDAWIHFFRLRSDIAATGKPHPQAQELANPLREEFIERQYITREDLDKDSFAGFDVAITDTNLKD